MRAGSSPAKSLPFFSRDFWPFTSIAGRPCATLGPLRKRLMTASIKAEIERLRDELNRHNYLYYIELRPEISDLDFDRLLKRLQELEAKDPEYDAADNPSHN